MSHKYFTHDGSLVTLHCLQTNSLYLMRMFATKLFCSKFQHLLFLTIDLDLSRAHHGDGDTLLCVHPGALDLQCHGVQWDLLDCLDTWDDNGSTSSNVGW